MDRELRRVLLVAVGIVVVLFTGRAIIGALYDDDAMMRQAATLAASCARAARPRSPTEGEEMAALTELRDQLAARPEQVLPGALRAASGVLVAPGGSGPAVRRDPTAATAGAGEGRGYGALGAGNLGMPDQTPTGLGDVAHAALAARRARGRLGAIPRAWTAWTRSPARGGRGAAGGRPAPAYKVDSCCAARRSVRDALAAHRGPALLALTTCASRAPTRTARA
jgi:hypothetical protein